MVGLLNQSKALDCGKGVLLAEKLEVVLINTIELKHIGSSRKTISLDL